MRLPDPQLLDVMRRTLEERPILLFEPSPAFREFVASDAPQILVRAANRVGKSHHAAYVAADRAATVPDSRVRFVGPNRAQTQNVTGRYLAGFLKGLTLAGSYWRHDRWNTNTILLKNGSLIQLKSLEDDVQTHAGDEFDLVVMDEVPKPAHFTENLARITSRKGRMIVIMTPVDRPVKWFREMVEDEANGWLQFVARFSARNCPWYDAEQIEQHMQRMRSAPWQLEQRINGAWDGVSDSRILDGFNEESIVDEIPSGVKYAISMDHGRLAGSQVIILWAHDGTRAWVVDEYIAPRSTTPEEDAGSLRDMLLERGVPLSRVTIVQGDINLSGSNGHKVNTLIEKQLRALYSVRRLPFRITSPDKGRDSIEWGLRTLNYAFRRRELLVHRRCTRFADACRHYKGTNKGADKDLVHIVDTARYGATALLGKRNAYVQLRFA